MKKIIGLLVIVGLLGLLGWQIYQQILESRAANARSGPPGSPVGRPGGPFTKPAVAVEIAEVHQQTIQAIGQFTGLLLPKPHFMVVPKVSGRLLRIFVNVGDRVKRDQLIAQLDNEEFQQQVKKAKADLEVAKANLAESQSALAIAKRDFDRVKSFANAILNQRLPDHREVFIADMKVRIQTKQDLLVLLS